MEPSLAWRATEHRHIERGHDWYWALGIIAVSSALTAIIFGNVLFALLLIVAATTFALIAMRPPASIDFALSEDGLSIGDEFYPYDEMRTFWIEDGEHPLLLIDTPRFMTPDLAVPLDDADVASIHRVFAERVLETPLRESPLFILLETMGL